MVFILSSLGLFNIYRIINEMHHINKGLKPCDHLNAKTFDKIQHPFLIKTLTKIGTVGTYFKIIKTIYERPTANIILSCEKLKAFPVKSGMEQGCPSHLFYSPTVLVTAIRQRQVFQSGREVVKLSLYVDDRILCIAHPKHAT